MDKKIRVLIVGLGRMGHNHLRALLENPAFEVAGVVDPKLNPGDSVAPYATYRHMNFSTPRPDAAIVATPAAHHMQAVTYLLSRRIPTLIEKPITLRTVDQAIGYGEQLCAVGHIERFNPAVCALKKSLEYLGDVTNVSAVRTGGERPEDAEKRGGVTMDLAVHDLDVCRWLFGKLRVDFADCTTDHASVRLLSQNGIDVEITAGWGGCEKRRELQIVGSCGVVQLDYQKRTLIGENLPVVQDTDPLRAEHDAFAHFVRTGERGDLCSPEDAFAVVRLAEHAVNAHGFV